MRILGAILAVAGLIWGVVAFNMSTHVHVPENRVVSPLGSYSIPAKDVHNLDLADRRQTHLMISGAALLIGTLLVGFGSLKGASTNDRDTEVRSCPFCAEDVKIEAKLCKHCGKELPAYEPVPAPKGPGAVSLHQATWDGSWSTVNRLLNEGADVNQKNEEGRTALELARARGDHVIASLLVTRGATEQRP